MLTLYHPYTHLKNSLSAGFTLLELLISILVLSILISIGLPSFLDTFDENRLVGASEQIYGHVQQARIESIARSNTVTINFSSPGSEEWVYGFTQGSAACDLSKASPSELNACTLVVNDGDETIHGQNGTDNDDLILNRFVGNDFTDVILSTKNFTNLSSSTQITFDPMRGLSDSGEITLTSKLGNKLTVKVSRLGMVRLCSPDGSVGGYSEVNC